MSAAIPHKILIMAGGTGGHVFPALTIARELLAKGAQVEWLGTKAGIEAGVIGETDIPLHFISASGLRGKSLRRKLLAPFSIIRAVWQSVSAIRQIKPACVLGMGGFVTGPGGVAARILGKPLLIHEQNAIAGMSNQLLFPLAQVVMEAFSGAFARKQARSTNPLLKLLFDPEKPVLVGNPVRADILAVAEPSVRMLGRDGPLRLLVVGGSLGAVAINKLIPELLAALEPGSRPEVLHQCGKRNLEQTLEQYRSAGLEVSDNCKVVPFIDDMAAAYGWADLILCRSGASTIAEITTIGLPSILIPFPAAVDDHQSANAKALEEAGGCWLIAQQSLSVTVIKEILMSLKANRQLLLDRAIASRSMAMRDAGSRAASLCLEACHA